MKKWYRVVCGWDYYSEGFYYYEGIHESEDEAERACRAEMRAYAEREAPYLVSGHYKTLDCVELSIAEAARIAARLLESYPVEGDDDD